VIPRLAILEQYQIVMDIWTDTGSQHIPPSVMELQYIMYLWFCR